MLYIEGKCPACGGRLRVVTPTDRDTRRSSPLVAMTARVECLEGCANKDAATKVLDLDHRHVLDQTDNGWSIEHPVTCRLDGKRLTDCEAHRLVSADLNGRDPGVRGRFYVELSDESPWGFTTEAVTA